MKSYAPYDDVPVRLTALAPAGDNGGGGGGSSGGGAAAGSILSTLGAIAAGANPVGIVITAVVALFAALGVRIRGTTRHLSFDEVQGAAQQFAQSVSQVIINTYGASALLAIQEKVPARFLPMMQQYWGLGPSQNQQIAYDVQVNHIFYRQLWLFATWIGTNVDADRPETYTQFMRDLFVMIFGVAIQDAGYDPKKLASISAAPPGGSGGGPTPPAGGGGSQSSASVASYGGAVLAIGLLAYLFSKAK